MRDESRDPPRFPVWRPDRDGVRSSGGPSTRRPVAASLGMTGGVRRPVAASLGMTIRVDGGSSIRHPGGWTAGQKLSPTPSRTRRGGW